MAKMTEIVLQGSKKYKGSVRWVKLAFPSGLCKVERRRPFGWDSYRITKEEYDFIDTPRKAELIWAYHHYMGCSDWWGGRIRHPISEFNVIAEEVLMNEDQYKHGLHYNSTIADVINWMFYEREAA